MVSTPPVTWKEVSFGYKHAIGLSQDGGVLSWGSNSCCQLGIPKGSTWLGSLIQSERVAPAYVRVHDQDGKNSTVLEGDITALQG